MKEQRLRVQISGLVQGIGFRPYIYRLAKQLNLTGWVRNNGDGVVIEIQGKKISQFMQSLTHEPPRLSKIESVSTVTIAYKPQEMNFVIEKNEVSPSLTKIAPDMSVCEDCLCELFNPDSRFYYYPFINCTQCGPRISLTKNLPYDRSETSMADFKLCETCQKEYEDPDNRRYHAQPIACQACGPSLSLAVQEIVSLLARGDILAIKGTGGYQLLCDARNEKAVLELRRRKQRPAKPLAVMVLNLESVHQLVECDPVAEDTLMHWARPIVLLPKKGQSLNEAIAPKLNALGVMLPSTPLHYLIFHGLAGNPKGLSWLKKYSALVLVVTSANVSDEPLLIDDEAARQQLKGIADLVIPYNRKIITRMDDSVLQVIHQKTCFVRRARGFVPTSIPLPHAIPCTLAAGGYLKNTFCIIRRQEAFISQHLGDLKTAATIRFFHETLDYFLKYLNVKPECIAHDLHPDFYTSRFAENFAEQQGIPLLGVQHHHAHIAAVAAEYGIQTPVIGLALDGYGYGEEGSAWGGEVFLYRTNSCKRLAHLRPVPQPGGDIAAQQPWRMAVSLLHQLGQRPDSIKHFNDLPETHFLFTWLEKNKNLPQISSCGRLFDAASALLGVCMQSQYEGQAAMELESLVTKVEVLKNTWLIENDTLNLLALFKHLLNCDPVTGANIFHGTLAAAFAEWVGYYAKKFNTKIIVISGGCFLNKILSENFIQFCNRLKLKVFYPQWIPPNDGGISLGQAWLAGNKMLM